MKLLGKLLVTTAQELKIFWSNPCHFENSLQCQTLAFYFTISQYFYIYAKLLRYYLTCYSSIAP